VVKNTHAFSQANIVVFLGFLIGGLRFWLSNSDMIS